MADRNSDFHDDDEPSNIEPYFELTDSEDDADNNTTQTGNDTEAVEVVPVESVDGKTVNATH